MKNINPDTINRYIQTLNENGVSHKSIMNKLKNINKYITWAFNKGQISSKKFEQIKFLIANRIKDLEDKNSHDSHAENAKQDQNYTQILNTVPTIQQFDKAIYHGVKNTDGLAGEINVNFKLETYKIKSVLKGILRHIPLLGGKIKNDQDDKLTSVDLQARHYLAFGLIMLIISFLSIGIYNQFFRQTNKPQAFPTSLTRGSRTLSFQGRLTDSLGNPIITSTNVVFKLHTAASGGSQLYTSGTCAITPDQDGILSTVIGEDCGAEIDSATFSENSEVFLGITVGSDSEMTPRQQIANVGYAVNAETLQGFPPDSLKNSIPYIDNQGDIKIAATSPSIVSNYASQGFLIGSAQALTLQAAGAGDVTLTATESGTIKFLTGGTQAGVVTNGQLWGLGTTGPDAKLDSLYTGGEQLRLTYTDGSVYTGFTTNSSGDLTIAASGGDLAFTDTSNTLFQIKDQGVYPFINIAGKTDTGDPASCAEGDIYYNDTDDTIKICHESNTWETLDGGGTLVWTDSGTTSYLTDTTDEVVIGGSSPLSSAKLSIDGDADQIQFLVQGNATQTSNLALFEDSAGTDLLSISGAGVLSVPYLVDISNTAYGIDPAGTSNFGGYSAKVTGGALLAYDTGNVGIGTTGPDAKLDVASTTEQLRLSYTDGAVYSSQTVDSSGNLTIDNTGTKTVIADDLQVTGNDVLDSSATSRVTLGATTTLTNTALTLSGTATLTASSLTAFNCSDCIDFDDLEDTLDVDAAVVLNQGSNTWTQNFTGTSTTGQTFVSDSVNTGIGSLYSFDGLSTGIGMSLTSTSTALTSGSLLSLDWSPTATTATGDLFKINIGSNGNVGNLLNITDNTSSLFRVAENQIESSIPHSLSAPGDVSIAYDLLFSNQTASYIKSSAPLYIEAGELFESNDLSLKTYNSGDLVLDLAGGVTFAQAQAWDLTNSSTTSLNIESGLLNLDTTNSRVAIGSTAPNEALDVEGEIEFDIDIANDTTIGVCKDLADGNTDVEFRECSGTPSDIAEYYLAEKDLRPGDIVVISENNGTMIAKKSSQPYQETAFGVVSTYPVGQFGKPLGHELYKNQIASAIGLNGRVPVKVSLENGPIAVGDPLTTSSQPGVAMKATKTGTIIGRALEAYNGSVKISPGTRQQELLRENSMMKFNSDPIDPSEQGVGKILVFNNITSYSPESNVYSGIINDQPTQNTVSNIIASIPEITMNKLKAGLIAVGDLVANSISTGNATIDSIIAKTITTEKLVAKTVTTDTIETKNATVSGELATNSLLVNSTIRAKNIESDNITEQQSIILSLREKLKDVAKESETSKQELSNSVNNIQQTLSDMESEPLPDPQYYQNIDGQSIGSITISSNANIYDLFVSHMASIGNVMIQDNTISSSMNDLKLTALESINLMDGTVVIAKDGTITTKGTLIAKGGIKTNNIKSLDKTDVAVTLEKNADSTKTNQFQIKDEDGNVVSSIDDNGKAKFTEITLDGIDTATDSGTIIAASENYKDYGINAPAVITNASTSGTATMPAQAIDLIVYNSKINAGSLIYITPTTPTQNNNIYVAYKEPCSQITPPTGGCKPFFKVSIDNKINTDVKFNWLIINNQ